MICISVVAKTRGVGFIILNENEIIDFGVKRFTKANNKYVLISTFINWIEVGDIKKVYLNKSDSDEATEASLFLCGLREILSATQIDHSSIDSFDLKRVFLGLNREEISSQLEAEVPFLSHLLPNKKKLWQSESANMLVFDAAAQLRTRGLL